MESQRKYTLQISCPDQKGLIAAVTNVLHLAGANIIDLNQHTALDIERFFLRAVFECSNDTSEKAISGHVAALAEQYQMDWNLFDCQSREKVAILVSKTDHCLHELLLNHRDGHLQCDFVCIISNHPDLQPLAQNYNIPYFHIGSELSKAEKEQEMEKVLVHHQVNSIVMARYMQILTPEFCDRWQNRIINIHHGFLPAFQGARPYHQAWEKGVKMIGATAHFATSDLDQGPIIWQNVVHIPDTYSISDLVHRGKDIERSTLLHALQLYLERRVFVNNARTFLL